MAAEGKMPIGNRMAVHKGSTRESFDSKVTKTQELYVGHAEFVRVRKAFLWHPLLKQKLSFQAERLST